jgi:putative phosphonate metabolism protein
MSPRYAIYFAPAETSALWRAGSEWLGRDAARNVPLVQPAVPGLSAERVRALTRSPRSYGFHATLKPPFRLAPGRSAAELRDALAQFAATRPAFALPQLEVAPLAGFLALRPAVRSAELHAFADECVVGFDAFRAPADQAELTRRRAAGLTPQQEALLAHFGYPYVLDEYRFHMTLTEPLEPREQALLQPWLRHHFLPTLQARVRVQEVCLFAEQRPGAPFRIIERFALRLNDA